MKTIACLLFLIAGVAYAQLTSTQTKVFAALAEKWERDAATILHCPTDDALRTMDKVIVLMHAATELRLHIGSSHAAGWVPLPWPADDSRGDCSALPPFARPESVGPRFWTPAGFVLD